MFRQRLQRGQNRSGVVLQHLGGRNGRIHRLRTDREDWERQGNRYVFSQNKKVEDNEIDCIY